MPGLSSLLLRSPLGVLPRVGFHQHPTRRRDDVFDDAQGCHASSEPAMPLTCRPTAAEPTAQQAMAQALHDINASHTAAAAGDTRGQGHYARAAIDSLTTTLVDPAATEREVVAAHVLLSEALALDGRRNTCGTELIDTESETSALAAEDQLWLQDYLGAALCVG
jgi:hypothetical protein